MSAFDHKAAARDAIGEIMKLAQEAKARKFKSKYAPPLPPPAAGDPPGVGPEHDERPPAEGEHMPMDEEELKRALSAMGG